MGQAALKGSSSKDVLARVAELPTLPAVPMKVGELLADPNSTSSQIAEHLRLDQVLTAKILRLVNSGYYAIPGGVASVERALAFLGFNTVAQLVLGISVFSQFKALSTSGLTMADFWKHALSTAVASEVIARRVSGIKPEDAFTAGLLHDIGKLVLHEVTPDLLGAVTEHARQKKVSFCEAEQALGVTPHTVLGEAIASRWGLPQSLRLAIRFHHDEIGSSCAALNTQGQALVACVRLANRLAVNNEWGRSGDCSRVAVTHADLAPLGLVRSDVEGVEQSIVEAFKKAGGLFSVYS